MTNPTLWELAAQKAKEGPKKIGLEGATGQNEEKTRDESYLLIFGNKDCGKTSLLLRFLDREEQPRPTIALEYTFARRSRGSYLETLEDKDVGHLWELGGGPFLTNLLHIPLSLDHVKDMSLVLMLDLSKPEELWHTAEALLAATKVALTKLMQELRFAQPQAYEALVQSAKSRIPADHPDKELLKPFPVPLAIIGAKYDLFQDTDSEKKKLVCKTLRFLAHTNSASIVFYSTRMEGLVTRGRALLSQMVFGTAGSRGLSVDYQKPIFVPPGADSFADIDRMTSGALPTAILALRDVYMFNYIRGAPSDVSMKGASNPFDLWKAAFCDTFPQKNTTMEVRDDPAKDPQYKEAAIDLLRAMKDQELERLVVTKAREAEQERKLAVPIPRPSAAPTRPPPQPESSPEPTPRPTPPPVRSASPRVQTPQKPATPVKPPTPKTPSGDSGASPRSLAEYGGREASPDGKEEGDDMSNFSHRSNRNSARDDHSARSRDLD